MHNRPPNRSAIVNRSVRHALTFLIIGVMIAVSSLTDPLGLGSWSLVFLYPSATFLCLGLVYCGFGKQWFGKRADGSCSSRSMLWFGPYFALNELVWFLYVALAREPAVGQAAPNLYFGRRLTGRDIIAVRNLSFYGCLDLTFEFAESGDLCRLPMYRSIPILDGSAPTYEQLHQAVDWITEATAQGNVYVHCALGHGRTGTILIAWLVAARLYSDIDSALQQ